MQRIRASGDATVQDNDPLAILECRETIDARSVEAGRSLATARARIFGPPPGSVSARYRRLGVQGEWYHGVFQSEEDVKKYQEAKRAYQAALEVLKRLGQTTLNIVMRVAVYMERPRWLEKRNDPTPLALAELTALKGGLEALADHYGLARE